MSSSRRNSSEPLANYPESYRTQPRSSWGSNYALNQTSGSGANYPPGAGSSPTTPNGPGTPSPSYFPTPRGSGGFRPEDYYDRSPSGQGKFGVYADFNNAGPAYSSADFYRQYDNPQSSAATTPLKNESQDLESGKDLVTAPALGPEWDKNEGQRERDQRKKDKTQKLTMKRQRENLRTGKCCGGKLGYRQLVFIAFGFCIALIVTLYFVIPRAPKFLFADSNPLSSNVEDPDFERTPSTKFNFDASLNLAVNAKSSWVPLHFSNFKAQVEDLNTDKVVAESSIGSRTFDGRKLTPLSVPITFDYMAKGGNDTTWNDFYAACGKKYATTSRPALNLAVKLSFNVVGLIGKRHASTSLNNLACPVEIQDTGI